MVGRRRQRKRRKSSELASWKEVKKSIEEKSDRMNILIGNGASQAVWEGFGYKSIYEEAERIGYLVKDDIKLFKSLKTENFERVLSVLRRKIATEQSSGYEADMLKEQYVRVKDAMCNSIIRTHISWAKVSDSLTTTRKFLRDYNFIFSTNYDLLVYWSIVEEDASFVDYFWNKKKDESFFDPANTQVWGDKTKILYLHGALHLETTPDRKVRKKTADRHRRTDLLRQTLKSTNWGDFPLVITEGDSEQKMLSIRKSDYLKFALEEFSHNADPLIIFGHSLSPQDNHLIKALEHTPRTIAVSVQPEFHQGILRRRREFNTKLHDASENSILYFNSETHPLGRRSLRVDKYRGSGKDNIRSRIRERSQTQVP